MKKFGKFICAVCAFCFGIAAVPAQVNPNPVTPPGGGMLKPVPHKPFMLEHFSSSTCTSMCPEWNEMTHRVCIEYFANDSQNAYNFYNINYQVDVPVKGDVLVTEQTDSYLKQYYHCYSVPVFYANGKQYSKGFSEFLMDVGKNIKSMRDSISPLELSATLSRTGNAFEMAARVSTYQDVADTDTFRLMTVFIEDSIRLETPGRNGEQVFFNVARLMLPSRDGLEFEAAPRGLSGYLDFSVSVDFDTAQNLPQIYTGLDKLHAVVFIQNVKTREIIQAKYLTAQVVKEEQDPKPNDSAAVEKPLVARVLKLYPNPARHSVKVEYTAARTAAARIDVLDINGRKVLSQAWNDAGTACNLNIENLPEGLYFVQVVDGRNVSAGKLTVK